jgi:hypothetical protein
MKSYQGIKFSLILFVALTWLSACSDDDKTPTVENTIKMDGSTFNVASASLLGVSIDGEGHAGITFTNTDGSVTKSLTVDFEYSPLTTLSATYSYPQVTNKRLLDDWLTTYSEFNQTTEMTSTNLESGTLTLEDNGNSKYTVTIDLTMVDGKVFRGTYKGTVTTFFNNN